MPPLAWPLRSWEAQVGTCQPQSRGKGRPVSQETQLLGLSGGNLTIASGKDGPTHPLCGPWAPFGSVFWAEWLASWVGKSEGHP